MDKFNNHSNNNKNKLLINQTEKTKLLVGNTFIRHALSLVRKYVDGFKTDYQ